MELNISDKVVLITGSSSGIGKGLAKAFYKEGCQIILNGKNEKKLVSVKNEFIGASAFKADLTKPQNAKKIIKEIHKKYGRLDVLVCNIGSGRSVPPGEETFDEWQRMFNLNFWSATNIVEASKELLIKSKGSILCISSICGSEIILNAPLTYSCAKAALNMYIKGMAKVLGKTGVRINAIAPGNILFEGSVWQDKLSNSPNKINKMIKNEVPLNTFGDLCDIANLALFLTSPSANFITGSVYTVDGGQAKC